MARSRIRPVLSEVQLEIMNIIWDQSPCSIADIWNVLRERRGVSRNTAHTLVMRLKDKGWLIQESTSSGFRYRAAASRESTQQRGVQKMIETLFAGSAEGLVLTLLDGKTLSKTEAERIRRLIDNSKARKS